MRFIEHKPLIRNKNRIVEKQQDEKYSLNKNKSEYFYSKEYPSHINTQ